jgi:sulfite exporter TauE/SafE
MPQELSILIITAASLGFVHTLFGPDHYLPFIVMSKARGWSLAKTSWITGLCGLGHVLGSIVIGAIGILLGIGIQKLEFFEATRGNWAAWAFIFFGFFYMLYGFWKARQNKPHVHKHLHDGYEHVHEHTHENEHYHVHDAAKKTNLTPWILFLIFVLGPCEPLIPVLMYPAAQSSVFGVVMVALVFGVVTIATMLTVVILAYKGFKFIPLKPVERYIHAIAGGTILLSGCAIVFLGL